MDFYHALNISRPTVYPTFEAYISLPKWQKKLLKLVHVRCCYNDSFLFFSLSLILSRFCMHYVLDGHR